MTEFQDQCHHALLLGWESGAAEPPPQTHWCQLCTPLRLSRAVGCLCQAVQVQGDNSGVPWGTWGESWPLSPVGMCIGSPLPCSLGAPRDPGGCRGGKREGQGRSLLPCPPLSFLAGSVAARPAACWGCTSGGCRLLECPGTRKGCKRWASSCCSAPASSCSMPWASSTWPGEVGWGQGWGWGCNGMGMLRWRCSSPPVPGAAGCLGEVWKD